MFKKVVLVLVIGSAIGYCIRKMQEDGQFDSIYNSAEGYFGKIKKNIKNAADIAKNEAGYLKGQIEDKLAK